MANEMLRAHAKKNKIPLWRIAESLHISEFTLSRKLRHELPKEEKFLIESIIQELSENQK